MVVSQDPTQPFIAHNFTIYLTNAFSWFDQLVGQALMIPFPVVMDEERGCRSSEGVFAEEDHSIERFGFDRSHEAFQVRIEIR